MPGLLQHVIVRGMEKREIFIDVRDRGFFVNRLSTLLQDTGVKCYAWSLLSNHVHILVMPTSTSLALFMRRLLTGYAVYFNRRHNRSGHLFQNRYKSIACEEETYLLELVRYIHLNPLRAGLVANMTELDGYPWSGHAVLMGAQQLDGQVQMEILSRFGKSTGKARIRYRQFLADGAATGRRDELVGGGLKRSKVHGDGLEEWGCYDERILGSGEFVDSLKQLEELRGKISVKMALPELISRAALIFNLPQNSIRRPAKAKQFPKPGES
jgi:putative transposase